MIKLIKTINKNGVSKDYPILANQEQVQNLLKDKRFRLVEKDNTVMPQKVKGVGNEKN
jgi:hypothetical protein